MLEPEVSPGHEARVRARAMECRARIDAGEDFTELATALSDEPTAVRTGGKLGFFSFEQMVEPFSRTVFAMTPGEITGPVKTQYGYHIIKLHEIEGDRRNAQHILFALKPDREDTLMTLDTLTRIRKRLLDGEKFDDLFSEYNRDPILTKTNGYMVWQKPSDMLPSFMESVRDLKEGDVSPAFVSILSLHIVLVDSINYDPEHLLEGLPPFLEEASSKR